MIDDKYLVLSLASCDGCEATTAGILIVNILTRQEKYLQEVGDIQINSENNTFTYKKLALVKEPCTGEFCDNGQRTVYRTSGQTFTETLP